jgi:hypothetical protein
VSDPDWKALLGASILDWSTTTTPLQRKLGGVAFFMVERRLLHSALILAATNFDSVSICS